MECVKSGHQQSMIHESAWEQLQRVESGSELVVGVNSHSNDDEPEFEGMIIDPKDEHNKVEELVQMKSNRDDDQVRQSLSVLEEICRGDGNVMDALIDAIKSEATVGEVNGVMRNVFGTWIAPSGV